MKVGEAVFLAVSVGITGAGVLATVRANGRRAVRAAPARWTLVTDGLRSAFGSVGAFYAILVASVVPLILLTWPLGAWSHYKPLSSWNDRVLHAYDSGRNHPLTSALKVLTQMGNWYPIVAVALVASALLAWASKTKRWLPPLVIISTLLGERYLQKAITNITHVQHPPTDLGTYPSGGVARLVCIYGIVGFMALRVLAPRSRRALIGGLWLLTLLTWIEGYSRIHLQKHWLLDPIGGLILGAGILAVAVAASTLLPWPEPEPEDTARHRGGGRRRRQRAPLRVRASHVVPSSADVGEVVLDGIAENGDPASEELVSDAPVARPLPSEPVSSEPVSSEPVPSEPVSLELVSLEKAAAGDAAPDPEIRVGPLRARAARISQRLRTLGREPIGTDPVATNDKVEAEVEPAEPPKSEPDLVDAGD